jgi:Flp pilus assembly protein CpaB
VRLPEDDLRAGAITDAAALKGQVAATDIYPNQQLAAADFKSGEGVLAAELAADARAISVPVDATHGLIGQVNEGDHVDVYGTFEAQDANGSRPHPVLKVLAQNVPVLKLPQGKAPADDTARSPVTLKVGERVATQIAFAVDNGKVWLALRPASGTRDPQPGLVTLESVLGIQPAGTAGK